MSDSFLRSFQIVRFDSVSSMLSYFPHPHRSHNSAQTDPLIPLVSGTFRETNPSQLISEHASTPPTTQPPPPLPNLHGNEADVKPFTVAPDLNEKRKKIEAEP